MKKHLSYILFALSVLFAITSCDKETFEYKINGKLPIDGYDGRMIYLSIMDSTRIHFINIDSTIINKDTFSFEGKLNSKDDAMLVYVFIGREEGSRVNMNRNTIILEPGEITALVDSSYKLYATGTPENVDFGVYMDVIDKLKQDERRVYDSIYKDIAEKKMFLPRRDQIDSILINRADEIKKERNDLTYSFFTKVANHPVFIDLLMSYSRNLSKEQYLALTADSLVKKEILKTFARYDKAQRQIDEERSYIKLGDQYAEMFCKDINGKEVKLSQFVSNSEYTLLYFWSSGCPGSYANMPFLGEAHQEYKDKGFNIVGVCDGFLSMEEWTGILDIHKPSYPQILPLPGGKDAMAIYGMLHTPFSILVDRSGKILEKDIPASQLKDRFKEYHQFLQMQEINPATRLSPNP